MNERIKELAVQSMLVTREDDKLVTGWVEYADLTEEIEKFAEMLIRECVDVLMDVLPAVVPEAKDGVHPVWHVKEHFGIEE